MKKEISWSILHPAELDVGYVSRVLEEATRYRVDSIEICGPCHGRNSGMNAVLDYQPYPVVHSTISMECVEAARKDLNTIVELSHSAGKPVLFWHREVIVPEEILKDEPRLLDKDGEFDLLGEHFERLMRYKIDAFFRAVPGMDGLVLTLTEADYSVIHNSRPDRYPPEKVVEKIVRIFASELQKRQKRFVLRSFGSIAQDYEDILAGAKRVADGYDFEIETKITPYDFVPFLPANPFLYKIDNCALSAECDSVGEFLGAGYLPAANVENIVRYVREGKAAGVDRFALRVDRVGNNIFDTHEVNLFAYHCAIERDMTPDEIWKAWAELRWPECADEMIALGKKSYDFIARANYIAGNVIFHKFPPNDDIAWLKLGGIFALFSDNKSLHELSGIWSIMADDPTPGRKAILMEKREAVRLAEEGLDTLKSLEDKLSQREYNMAFRLWSNAVFASKGLLIFCRAVSGYFDAMEAGDDTMDTMLKEEDENFATLLQDAPPEVSRIYLEPLRGMMMSLKEEFRMEVAERRSRADAYDLVVCGSLTDEWRTGRYQHGSKAVVHRGRLGREIGNRVFPNGFISTILAPPTDQERITLRVEGAADISRDFNLTVNGKTIRASLDAAGVYSMPLTRRDKVEVRVEKHTDKYPVIHTIGLYPR